MFRGPHFELAFIALGLIAMLALGFWAAMALFNLIINLIIAGLLWLPS